MAMDIDQPELQDELHNIIERSSLTQDATESLRRLADASRSSITIRQALSSERILLKLVTSLQEQDTSNLALNKEILRCVGNACASNPPAIIFVAKQGLGWLHRFLVEDSAAGLHSLGLKVLYNICAADFDEVEEAEKENPALDVCFHEGIHLDIVSVLVKQQPDGDDVEMLVDLLLWISTAVSSEVVTQPTDRIVWEMLNVQWFETFSRVVDADVLASLVESMLSLLRPRPAVEAMVAHGQCLNVFGVLTALDARLQALAKSPVNSSETRVVSEEESLLAPQAAGVTWLLSDISADSSFAKVDRLSNASVQHVTTLLQVERSANLTDRLLTAASLVLGNALLNMPQEDTISLVRESEVVRSLFAAVMGPRASPDLLHAAASLLVILCRPSVEIREVIAADNSALPAISKLCSSEMPQVRDGGIRALRAMGQGSAVVQQQFVSLANILRSSAQFSEVLE